MSCLSYLIYLNRRFRTENAGQLESIKTSIWMLSRHIASWRFTNDVLENFAFGSFTRDTNLPTCIDTDADIDYMVVFNTMRLQPDTYLDRLRKFAKEFYPRTHLYQDHPTMVLDMTNIKFEISPATQQWGKGTQFYHIPAPHQSLLKWINTDPRKLKSDLDAADRYNHNLLLPVIRLLKYWNVLNGKEISSYKIEDYVIHHVFFGCHNLKDYFFEAAKWMNMINGMGNSARNKIQVLRSKIEEIEELESQGHKFSAEEKLEEILPDF